VIAPSGEQITITAGDQQAVIVEVGGGLRSYSTGGRELVDGYRADEMSSSGRGQVLIPWPNRLRDGSYEFDGRRHQLPLNVLRDPDRGTQVSLWVDQSYPYFMIFSGDSLPNFNRRSLAVEPMTCPPNAFRTGHALIRLEPGSSLTSTWGIAPGSAHRR